MKLNPFDIEGLTDEFLVDRIKSLIDAQNEEASTMTELSENVILLADVIYLYGELLSRVQKSYSLIKFENGLNETKLAYELKSNSDAKYPMSYFNALAQEKMLEKKSEEFELQKKQTELKYAYDATQERINAIKKKIDSIKFEGQY